MLLRHSAQTLPQDTTFNYFACISTSGIGGSNGNFTYNFSRTTILSSTEAVPLYILTRSVRGLVSPCSFKHLFSAFLIAAMLASVTSMGVRRYFIVVFESYIPNDKWYCASFYVLTGHWCIFFREMSIQIVCPILNWVIGLFCCWILGTLYILLIILYQMWFVNTFSHSVGCE